MPVYFFETDAEKGVPNRKTRFPQKKNKKYWNVFCSKMEVIVYRNIRLEKSVKIVAKSYLIEKKQTFVSIILNCICGSEGCSTT